MDFVRVQWFRVSFSLTLLWKGPIVPRVGAAAVKSRAPLLFQAKPERTAEESDRLRKLMLEWQFQKRLQESKQSDEDEEEEDDEDVDTMMIMQRLEAEKRARVS